MIKKISISVVFCLLMAAASYGQTLQFSQVLFFGTSSGVQTVPAGKVWKITHVTQTGYGYGNESVWYIRINNVNYYARMNADRTGMLPNESIWLPAAATLETSSGTGCSVIEFTIMP